MRGAYHHKLGNKGKEPPKRIVVLKENFTLVHEIWLLLINYNFLSFYNLSFLKHQKIDKRSSDNYVFLIQKHVFIDFLNNQNLLI